jgi:alcohol dehydrogenase
MTGRTQPGACNEKDNGMGMPSFQHITSPLRLFSGADSLKQLDRELGRANSQRAAIFCGSSLAREGSPLTLVKDAIGNRLAGVFSGVRAHSPVPAVQAGAEELKRLEADAVVVVGGGSAIVTARAASIVLAEKAHPKDLCTYRNEQGELRSPKLLAPKLPQLVIPTTPNTATVKAGSAVFDPDSGQRLALFDPKTRAQSVFIHPALLTATPDRLVTTAGLDTLSLALEGLMSRSGDPIADAQLIHAVRLLAQHLPARVNGKDVRSEHAIAAVLCGQGTDHTGAGIATVLGHAIGGRFDVENGIVKAIVLPHVLRFNAEAAATGLAKIAIALGLPQNSIDPAGTIVGRLREIFGALGLPDALRSLDVPRDALPVIAEHAMGDWFLRGNPRPVRNKQDLLDVLTAAW